MRANPPYWQNYWYDLHFRKNGTASFKPLGRGDPQQLSNKALATHSLEEYVEWFLDQAIDELDDLRGELQMIVYAEAAPTPTTKPVLVRTVPLGRR
jgi:hypothetical protein